MKYIATITTQLQFTVIIEPDGNRFHAYCPELKGLHTEGISKEEVVLNATSAVLAYITSMVKHGDPLPRDTSVSVVWDAKATKHSH